MTNITFSDISRCLTKGEKEFLWEFEMDSLYKAWQFKSDECFEFVRNNLRDIKGWESDIDLNDWKYYDHLTLHCSDCLDNVLTNNAHIVFMALKMRNYLLKNMSNLYDLPNYEKEDNILTLNKLELTMATIKLRKTDAIAPVRRINFPYNNLYSEEKFAADSLKIDSKSAYNLVCNGKVVSIEPFPQNLQRAAKLFFEKGVDPAIKAKDSESMIKILMTLFAANIDHKTNCFRRNLKEAYVSLLPLQIDYYFDNYEMRNACSYNAECVISFNFLVKIDLTLFGCGKLTRKIIHVWMASKYFNYMPMTRVMDHMRVNNNTELMQTNVEVEEEIEKVLTINLRFMRMLKEKTSLADQLKLYEAKLLQEEHYIKFNPNLAYMK